MTHTVPTQMTWAFSSASEAKPPFVLLVGGVPMGDFLNLELLRGAVGVMTAFGGVQMSAVAVTRAGAEVADWQCGGRSAEGGVERRGAGKEQNGQG